MIRSLWILLLLAEIFLQSCAIRLTREGSLAEGSSRSLLTAKSIACPQCHNGVYTPSHADALRISKHGILHEVYKMQASPSSVAMLQVAGFRPKQSLPKQVAGFRPKQSLPKLSNVSAVMAQGTISGQCAPALWAEIDQECPRSRPNKRCDITRLIEAKAVHWLRKHVLPQAKPWPMSDNRLWKIDTSYSMDGAKVTMLSPYGVYIIRNFLRPDEADELVRVGGNGQQSMGIGCPVLRHHCYDPKFLTFPGNHCELRSGTNQWLNHGLSVSQKVQRKIEYLTRVQRSAYERLQVTQYHPGDFFSAHYDDDGCDEQVPEIPEPCSHESRRMITVITYLNDAAEGDGGATYFPDLHLRIAPKKGTAVVFFPVYTDGKLNPYVRHAGEEAYKTKYVSQQWISLAGKGKV
eukprot:gnl/TRDRNA2_/TRDRNA2_58924_c0_seq1.p1 gnl/TRDRNA2_/TRDRNA2_58924_c0~~gnl/TRDRNA2_/TRDRNA2_58924_c0_seq1.p1  ORF type:complete len:406 (+),score=55.96 gnl/TRDRNA2_/TRDRNA2_58924_c0_seq1:68-1285(+)